jgi:hypothetical protein
VHDALAEQDGVVGDRDADRPGLRFHRRDRHTATVPGQP